MSSTQTTVKTISDEIGDYLTESVVCLEPCPNAGRETSEAKGRTDQCKCAPGMEANSQHNSKKECESAHSTETEHTPKPTLLQQGKQVMDDIGDFITEAMCLEPCPHAGGRERIDSAESVGFDQPSRMRSSSRATEGSSVGPHGSE